MFKKIFVSLLIVVVIGAIAFSAYNIMQARNAQAVTVRSTNPTPILPLAANTGANTENGQAQRQGQNTQSNGNPNNGNPTAAADGSGHTGLAAISTAIPAGDLSEAESAALLYMIEEEQLARDVYNALYAIWGQPTFQNIAASEQMHMDALQALLDRYSLVGPDNAAGTFENPDLQALYDELVARGSQSLAEAIKVGGAIEEIDILDLQTYLAETDHADIQQVFNSLIAGSSNHLNAFANTLLKQTGETYQPQYLSVEAYQAIISSQTTGAKGGQTGNQGGNAQGGGQGGGQGYHGGQP